MNWLAILCAGAAYWVLGFVWYSLLFGKMWIADQRRVRGGEWSPSGNMALKMVSSFVSNVIAAAAMAYLFKRTGITDVGHAIKLAAAAGIGFSGTTLTILSVWESRPTRLWMIDAAHYFIGALVLALILVNWR